MEVIALFPGQGSQEKKMGSSFYKESLKVRDLFALASEIAKVDLYRVASDGSNEELLSWTQPLITLVSISSWLYALERGIRFAAHAGFSLGELAAYRAAGVFGDQELFEIVAFRSHLLTEQTEAIALEKGKSGMAAVLGLPSSAISTILKNNKICDLYIANDNAPTQVVLAGTLAALKAANPPLLAAGARRIIPLRVAGPFHTPLMSGAKEEFASYLSPIAFSDPTSTLYSSVTAKEVRSAEEAKALLLEQLTAPVLWRETLEALDQENLTFAEVGHGRVLAGLCKSNNTKNPALSFGSTAAVEQAKKEYKDA